MSMVVRAHPIASDFEIVQQATRAPLASHLEATVDALWNEELASRETALHNDMIFSVDDFSSKRVIGEFVEYRLFVAQRRRTELFGDLRVQPLAVCGLLESPDGLLFGKRAGNLLSQAGKWELLPAGGLDPKVCQVGASVDFMRQFYQELTEEVGIGPTDTYSPTPLILLEDVSAHVFDIVIGICTGLRAAEITKAFSCDAREHSELKFVPTSEVRSFVSAYRADVVDATIALLEFGCH